MGRLFNKLWGTTLETSSHQVCKLHIAVICTKIEQNNDSNKSILTAMC